MRFTIEVFPFWFRSSVSASAKGGQARRTGPWLGLANLNNFN